MESLTIAILPPEIHDAITVYLGLSDLCNLRLASRAVSDKLSGSQWFKSFYTSKTVLLCEKDLKLLEYNTREGNLGSLLENLTLVSPLRKPLTESVDTQIHALLLAAFGNILAHSKRGCLRSLTLKVDTHPQRSWINVGMSHLGPPGVKIDPWEHVWESARWNFHIAMTALAQCQLPLEGLDAFFSITRCSLTCDSILKSLGVLNLAPCLEHLKKLSLSLSRSANAEMRNVDLMDRVKGELDCIPCHSEVQGILRFLRLSPVLEKLQLHWYNTSDWVQPPSERYFFQTLAPMLDFPRLGELDLRGITVLSGPLSDFICRHPITRLTLVELHLGSCELQGWFDDFRGKLEYLRVDELRTPRLQRYRNAPGKSIFAGMDGGHEPGPHGFVRVGSDAKLPVEICEIQISNAHEDNIRDWVMGKRLEYGPPR